VVRWQLEVPGLSDQVQGLTELEQQLALGLLYIVTVIQVLAQGSYKNHCGAGSVVEQAVVGVALDHTGEWG